MRWTPLLWLFVCLCQACAGSQLNPNLKYGEAAAAYYAFGLDEFYDEDCLEAEPIFETVRKKYPYSRFAGLSELRLADCLFMEDKFPEAIQAYRQFVRYRPSHVEVSYAQFQVAASHHAQIPSDWFLVPPAHERDQHHAQQALRLIRRFILDHPNDPLVGRAKAMAHETLELLARHELYVAKFYLSRDQLLAATSRLKTLINSYPGSGLEPEALWLLGETYTELEDPKRAMRAYKELLDRYPKGDHSKDARQRLGASAGG